MMPSLKMGKKQFRGRAAAAPKKIWGKKGKKLGLIVGVLKQTSKNDELRRGCCWFGQTWLKKRESIGRRREKRLSF